MCKKIIIIFVLLFFFQVRFVFAGSIVIDEFMSDPTSGPEWIELLNMSSAAVDLSDYAWTELAGPGSDNEHDGAPKNLGGIIPAGGVFVFETNSSLNNAGDSIGLYNGSKLESRVTYGKVNSFSKNLDTPEKGKSGALINGEWQANQEPTKNIINPSFVSAEVNTNENTSSEIYSLNKTIPESKSQKAEQKIRAEITTEPVVLAGIPFSIEGKVFGTQGEQIFTGKYYWNFGDGDFRETKVINIDKFKHTYFYPGDYVVLFNHYPDIFTDIPDATEKFTIKVVSPEIYISSVGNEKDFFVEIANNAEYDADLSDWFLLSNQGSFLIPKGTILVAKGKIVIPSSVTHFSVDGNNTLKLMTPTGELAPHYSSSKTSTKISTKNAASLITSSPNSFAANATASVVDSDIALNKKAILPIFPVISFLFIGASAGAVYFIRRQKQVKEPGSDFEILDE